MKKILYFLLCFVLFSFIKTDRVEKKTNQLLSKTFKNILLKKTSIEVYSSNKDEKWFELADTKANKHLGKLVTTSAVGRFDKFNYLVLFNPDKTIKKVRVLIYREQHGGEIASKRWLKQFEGKSIKSIKTLTNDVDAISGATLSCNAITNGIKSSIITIQKIK